MGFDLIEFIDSNQQSFHDVLDLIPIPLFIKDIKGRYISCNKAYEKASGKNCHELIGKTVYDLWPKQQADIFFAKDKELFDSPGQQIYEADISPSFDKKCIVQFHKVTFTGNNGEVIGLVGAIFDLTEKIELEEKLKRLSEVDDLTGLLNRRTGLERMEKVLIQSIRNKHSFVIATMDLDHFKTINDTYGHDAGDTVLQSVRALTSNILRGYDIICRYGGEEFIFCLPEVSIEEACIVLERIRSSFESEKIVLRQCDDISVKVSIGVASYPDHGQTIAQLINASDKALYDAKSAGRNCIKLATT